MKGTPIHGQSLCAAECLPHH